MRSQTVPKFELIGYNVGFVFILMMYVVVCDNEKINANCVGKVTGIFAF